MRSDMVPPYWLLILAVISLLDLEDRELKRLPPGAEGTHHRCAKLSRRSKRRGEGLLHKDAINALARKGRHQYRPPPRQCFSTVTTMHAP